MIEIAFDDIEGLLAAATEEWSGWGPEFEMTQEKINAFAELTGDHQWIHIDVERAKTESPFGGPIAHGFFTLSLVASISWNDKVRITGFRNAVNYGADGLRFLAPVPSGSVLQARSRLKEAREHKKGTLVAPIEGLKIKLKKDVSIIVESIQST